MSVLRNGIHAAVVARLLQFSTLDQQGPNLPGDTNPPSREGSRASGLLLVFGLVVCIALGVVSIVGFSG